ncbi:alpha-L-rhamnosidase [Catenulispora acidiphila DSM 44928]|uniref:Alpha-L-rhamnosidase n=1 Tax=Catenulispora acidiphila (strain DSM 44928 / JCM 14897 / NBRC 102108 / NRRL B-24433 / ID139908) TaxID=479433 RepID=C7Q7W6_CATAD|nr:trehalase family glycosidase [Catenulispora acidiphila]ACU74133.1 alpha-L-rhamnosidase [Catenulispora acidiphila DSM 44928]
MKHVPIALLAFGVAIGGLSTAVGDPAPAHATAAPHARASLPAAKPTATVNPCAADNLSPTSRTVSPVSVYATSGTVGNASAVLSGQNTRLTGNGSAVTLDFGKEVGGIVTLRFADASDSSQSVGLAFSESNQFVGNASDASSGGGSADGAITTALPSGGGSYTMPKDKLRGGFRYLTLFLNSGGYADLDGVSLAFSAAPNAANPAAYPDYFCSNDAVLNQVWYAGAYTTQLDTIDPTEGRVWPPPSSGWENNGVVGTGTEVLTDGAKRDRSVWPGDMGVSTTTAYVSTDDMLGVRNSLTTMYQNQKTTGELPYGGPEFSFYGSDTYHTWTLVGTYMYYLYTSDKAWLDSIWSKYQLGMTFITAKIDSSNLLNVTNTNDWARGDQTGENIEANALLYQALTTGAKLATAEGNSSLAATYASKAASLKTAVNAKLWDVSVGAYKDNPGSTLYPQDGNSLAVWYGLTSASQATAIMAHLRGNWNSLGAQAPEFNNNLSPFAGSMELYAHFTAGDDVNALNLIRDEWGYMLASPIGTASTFWEGYSNNGTLTAYSSPFTSLAHGWSTGPTGALTTDVLGISPTAPSGGTYQVVPHPGDLTHVEGTLTVASGKQIHAVYNHGSAGDFSLQVDSSTNAGSTGVIAVPTWGQSRTVTVNGQTAWNGSTFLGASGITSADTDGQYVYFRGVSPGVYTVAYSASATAPPIAYRALPGAWTRCAAENGNCAVSGASVIAYGTGGRFNYLQTSTAKTCSNASFGDPAPNVAKWCYVRTTQPASPGWKQCATENQNCAFSDLMTVAYGANGAYKFATLGSGGTACDDAVFGDPAPNATKACFLLDPPPTFATWTSCAGENGNCTFSGTHEVAFGANGQYFFGSFSGGTPCTVAVFGDPVFGTAKACYVE